MYHDCWHSHQHEVASPTRQWTGCRANASESWRWTCWLDDRQTSSWSACRSQQNSSCIQNTPSLDHYVCLSLTLLLFGQRSFSHLMKPETKTIRPKNKKKLTVSKLKEGTWEKKLYFPNNLNATQIVFIFQNCKTGRQQNVCNITVMSLIHMQVSSKYPTYLLFSVFRWQEDIYLLLKLLPWVS